MTAPAGDSTLARIVYLVEEAAAAKAPTQLLVDRFSRVYTPAVVALAVAVWIVPVVVTGAVGRPGGVERMAVASARGAGDGVPVCARHLDAGRARQRHQPGRARRRPGQGRRVPRTCGQDARGRLRQDGHAHDRPAQRGPSARDSRMGPAGSRSRSPPRSKLHSVHPLARAVVRDAEGRGLEPDGVEQLTELPGRGVSGLSTGQACRSGQSRRSRARSLDRRRLSRRADRLGGGRRADGARARRRRHRSRVPRRVRRVESGIARPSWTRLAQGGIEHTALLTGDNETHRSGGRRACRGLGVSRPGCFRRTRSTRLRG